MSPLPAWVGELFLLVGEAAFVRIFRRGVEAEPSIQPEVSAILSQVAPSDEVARRAEELIAERDRTTEP